VLQALEGVGPQSGVELVEGPGEELGQLCWGPWTPKAAVEAPGVFPLGEINGVRPLSALQAQGRGRAAGRCFTTPFSSSTHGGESMKRARAPRLLPIKPNQWQKAGHRCQPGKGMDANVLSTWLEMKQRRRHVREDFKESSSILALISGLDPTFLELF